MVWFKVDDKLHGHRKPRKAGVAAMGLWVLAGSWCADQTTDGFVPDFIAASLDRDSKRHAASLVAAGLWYPSEDGDDKGWQFHEWENMQPTRADIEENREKERVKKANQRRNRQGQYEVSPGDNAGDTPEDNAGTPPGSPTVPTRPDPTRPSSLRDDSPTKIKHTSPLAPLADEFEQFWAQYPRKVSKATARTAYAAARKKVTADVIALSLAVYNRAVQGQDPKYIKHPATWLRAEGWHDDPEAIAPNGHSKPQRQTETDDLFSRALARAQEADAQTHQRGLTA